MAKKNPVTEYLRQIGKNGGNARAEVLTAEERSEGARKAAKARWKKDEPEPEPTAPAEPGTARPKVRPNQKAKG